VISRPSSLPKRCSHTAWATTSSRPICNAPGISMTSTLKLRSRLRAYSSGESTAKKQPYRTTCDDPDPSPVHWTRDARRVRSGLLGLMLSEVDGRLVCGLGLREDGEIGLIGVGRHDEVRHLDREVNIRVGHQSATVG